MPSYWTVHRTDPTQSQPFTLPFKPPQSSAFTPPLPPPSMATQSSVSSNTCEVFITLVPFIFAKFHTCTCRIDYNYFHHSAPAPRTQHNSIQYTRRSLIEPLYLYNPPVFNSSTAAVASAQNAPPGNNVSDAFQGNQTLLASFLPPPHQFDYVNNRVYSEVNSE